MLVVLYCTVVFIACRLVIYINRNLLAPSKAAYSHNKSYSNHNRLVRAMLHFLESDEAGSTASRIFWPGIISTRPRVSNQAYWA